MNNFNLYLDNLVDQGYDIILAQYYFKYFYNISNYLIFDKHSCVKLHDGSFYVNNYNQYGFGCGYELVVYGMSYDNVFAYGNGYDVTWNDTRYNK